MVSAMTLLIFSRNDDAAVLAADAAAELFFILGSDPHAVNSTDNVNGIIIIFFVIFIISPMILYNLVYIEIKVGTTCKIMDFGSLLGIKNISNR